MTPAVGQAGPVERRLLARAARRDTDGAIVRNADFAARAGVLIAATRRIGTRVARGDGATVGALNAGVRSCLRRDEVVVLANGVIHRPAAAGHAREEPNNEQGTQEEGTHVREVASIDRVLQRFDRGLLFLHAGTRRANPRCQVGRTLAGEKTLALGVSLGGSSCAAERKHAFGGTFGLEDTMRKLCRVLVEECQRPTGIAGLECLMRAAEESSFLLQHE